MRVSKKHDVRLNEILDAAELLFTQKGYEQATVNDILDKVELGKGTFYHYFKSKEDVMTGVIRRIAAGRIAKGKRAESASIEQEGAAGEHLAAVLDALGGNAPAAASASSGSFNVLDEAGWEEFKACMRYACGGANNQPANVKCYEDLEAETAFSECKINVADESKRPTYYAYFHDRFLADEQMAECNRRKGLWDEASRQCIIKVVYKRYDEGSSNAKGVKLDSNIGCDDNETKNLVVGSRPVQCTARNFGKGECYSVDKDAIDAVKTQQTVGIATMAATGTGGVVTRILVGKPNASNDETEWNKGAVALGVIGGVGGLPVLLTANNKTVGRKSLVDGDCFLPDGSQIHENGTIELGW